MPRISCHVLLCASLFLGCAGTSSQPTDYTAAATPASTPYNVGSLIADAESGEVIYRVQVVEVGRK